MLRTDVLATRGDVADSLGAGRQPVSSTVRFLAEQGIDISEPVSDGDLRAVDALIRQVTAQQEADMAALTDAMSAGGGGGPEDQALIAELQESLPDATG
jgi:biotin operon repressor